MRKLYQAGKYPQALEKAKQVLAIAEKAFGSKDIETGNCLNNLAHGGVQLFQMHNLVSIDASNVVPEMFLKSHSYFRDNNSVVSDLYGLLRERKKVEMRPNLKKLGQYYSSWMLLAGS